MRAGGITAIKNIAIHRGGVNVIGIEVPCRARDVWRNADVANCQSSHCSGEADVVMACGQLGITQRDGN